MIIIEIFLLIFFSKQIRGVVQPKGYDGRLWTMRLIAFWILFEALGAIVSYMLGKDLVIMSLSGFLCALASAFFLWNKAKSLPNKSQQDDWKDQF